MSSATVEVGVSGDAGSGLIYLSHSSIQRLAGCEERYVRHLAQPESERELEAKPDYLKLGTLWGRLKAAYRGGRSWQAEWCKALNEVLPGAGYDVVGGELVEVPGWEAPDYFLKARRMMEAFVLVYGSEPEWISVGAEIPFDLPIPGIRGARVHGYIDNLERRGSPQGRDGELILVEEKTMRKWGPERRVWWDPQLLLYEWAAKQLLDVQGVLFDAASTFDYKPSKDAEHEDEASRLKDAERRFKRIKVPYNEVMIERNLDNVRRAAARAKALVKNPGLAVKNISFQCDRCPFKGDCLNPLGL